MKQVIRTKQQYIPSLRERFKAPDGCRLPSVDFVAGESYTHAQ